MKWIGLTGGIASGKSEVSRILGELGVAVVDADQLARQVLNQGQVAYDKVVAHFGPHILAASGDIDRKKLSAIVFSQPEERLRLERMVHPEVQAQVQVARRQLAGQGHPWAVYDVPLLFEKNLKAQFDRTVLVYCRPQTQIERLMKRNSLSRAEAEVRLSNQWPIDEKRKLVDDVIENEGSLQELKKNVRAWKQSIDARYTEPKA